MITCAAATMCFIPAIRLETNYQAVQVQPAAWTHYAKSQGISPASIIHTAASSPSWFLSLGEQKALKRALLQSVEVVDQGTLAE